MEAFSLTINISIISLSKCKNLGQFWNPQEKLILKLSLVVTFDKEMMEILTVKEKASIYELTTFFRRVYCQTPQTPYLENMKIFCTF